MTQHFNHKRSVGWLLVASVAIMSSGFTGVLQRCGSAEEMACCKAPAGRCDSRESSKTGASFESDISCGAALIIGGFAVPPAVMEKYERSAARPMHYAAIPGVLLLKESWTTDDDSRDVRQSGFNTTASPPYRYLRISSLLL